MDVNQGSIDSPRIDSPEKERSTLFAAIETLGRLTELMERRRVQLAREVGLTPQQWRALEGVSQEGFMPSLFARARASSPAGVSRTLRQLLEAGLVAVSASSSDARRRNYVLTTAGAQVLAELRNAREAALETVWAGLPEAEIAEFARFGSALCERLTEYASQAERTG